MRRGEISMRMHPDRRRRAVYCVIKRLAFHPRGSLESHLGGPYRFLSFICAEVSSGKAKRSSQNWSRLQNVRRASAHYGGSMGAARQSLAHWPFAASFHPTGLAKARIFPLMRGCLRQVRIGIKAAALLQRFAEGREFGN